MKALPTLANERNISRETIQMWKAEVFEYELKDALFLSTETENVLLCKCTSVDEGGYALSLSTCRRSLGCCLWFFLMKSVESNELLISGNENLFSCFLWQPRGVIEKLRVEILSCFYGSTLNAILFLLGPNSRI